MPQRRSSKGKHTSLGSSFRRRLIDEAIIENEDEYEEENEFVEDPNQNSEEEDDFVNIKEDD